MNENRCSNRACRNQPLSDEDKDKLLKCARCKTTKYCSKTCQKEDWLFHKHKCVTPDTAQHIVDGYTIEDIQRTIDQASPGDIIILTNDESYEVKSPEGGPTTSKLVINKPIKLWGKWRKSELNCNLEIKSSGEDLNDSVIVVDIIINGQVNISSNNYKSITLCEVNVHYPSARDDALEIGECKGECLILNCEIYGGSDGIFIASDRVHLKLTKINNAQSRGIFSRRDFILEDCTIAGCGAYGIKGSDGWEEKGRNDIQPGPWSSFGGGHLF